ncbi:aminotransferase class I/II-fold pyridoxal phosphate-dependent enzyme [Mogibacterium pumilum]|uniref:Aminotransferase n=1 Tax=Mogibacterium pumilum TaxID=86332 RepID=A0A223AQV7_9FIRM|nr:aminotransferase class I/II-fold pyridoxal phosphate-dependent enzyme [Mogibacterium pumilum]ASS37350.1 aminotransferase [Mogibacterium pumilum]
MQAIILAAGMGKRLKKLTQNNTKCMVKVNGMTMIERMLRQIDKRGVSRIVIVVGYEREKLKEYISTLDISAPIQYIDNPIYDSTNNIYSLSLASELLIEEDTLLFESDLIFEDSILDALIDDPRETLALVDKYESWMDGTVVKIDNNDNIIDFVPGKNFVFEDIPSYYKTVNIYKFSKDFSTRKYVPFLNAYQKALGANEYYEQVLKVITMIEKPEIQAKRLTGQKWYEIDDVQDLDIAESIFRTDEGEVYNAISGRFGGYWRYPKMLDYCYPINPYYPPQRLMNEIKANIETLITESPSGMHVVSLLAAKVLDVDEDKIVVGNGASEIIKSVIEESSGKVGFISPSFEEYYNRCEEDRRVVYKSESIDFSYSVDNLINHFRDKEISSLVVINPDNPTGNYIPKEDVLKLAKWCEYKGIQLIYDESFIDYAMDEQGSIISSGEYEQFANMLVIKSISKAHGVQGLRLGVGVSVNSEKISALKKSLTIWNINSISEFYLQIAEKYAKSYKAAICSFKETREKYLKELKTITSLRVFNTEANFVMVELLGCCKATDFCGKMLRDNGILIKDLSKKAGLSDRQLIRLSIRTEDENAQVVQAIRTYFDK